MGAERLLAIEGTYVELEALYADESMRVPERGVEDAVRTTFGDALFYYHRLALAEAALEGHDDGFRLDPTRSPSAASRPNRQSVPQTRRTFC